MIPACALEQCLTVEFSDRQSKAAVQAQRTLCPVQPVMDGRCQVSPDGRGRVKAALRDSVEMAGVRDCPKPPTAPIGGYFALLAGRSRQAVDGASGMAPGCSRVTAHVTVGWPSLGTPVVRYRGQYCYVAALLSGHREPAPILRLRWQGSPDNWAIAVYKASTGQYSGSELPGSFGPTTGTPERGIDNTLHPLRRTPTGN